MLCELVGCKRKVPIRTVRDQTASLETAILMQAHFTLVFSGWLKIEKSRVSTDNEYDMMMYLYRHCPIVVSINAQNLRIYSNKILSFCEGNHKWTAHIVVLKGFGVTDSGTPFWIARNSYGDDWGDGGYFLIERNVNMCGIGQWAYAAYITPS